MLPTITMNRGTRQGLEIPVLVTLDEPFNSFWPKFLSGDAGGRGQQAGGKEQRARGGGD